jgi:outer membrane cobalamin receptor
MRKSHFGPEFGQALALACMLAVARPSTAADAELSPKEYSAMSLEELFNIAVTAPSKETQPLSVAPANTIIITDNEIVDRGYRYLEDVLADLPGFETIDYSFTEYGTLAPVRGVVGNNKIILLINGMRVNPPGGEHMIMRNDISVRYAQRVEIVYGPGSTLYGADAVSAVINVVTQDKPGSHAHGLVGGGNHSNFDASAMGSTELGDGSVLAYAQWHQGNRTDLKSGYPDYFAPIQNMFDTKKHTANETLQRQDGYGLNTLLQIKQGHTTFQYWMRTSERSSGEAYYPALTYSNQARWGDTSHVARLENELKISDTMRLKSALSYNRYETTKETQYVFPIGDSYFYDDHKYARGRGAKIDEQLSWDIHKKVALTVGLMVGDRESVPKATVAGGFHPYGDLVSQSNEAFLYYLTAQDAAAGKNAVALKKLSEYSYLVGGLYAQGTWKLRENLRLVAGARLDRDSRFPDDTIFTPRGAVIFQPFESLVLRYVYAQAYVQAAPYFENARYQSPTTINTDNPNIRPERSESHELSAMFQHGGLSGSIGVFLNQVSDVFLIDNVTPGQPGYLGEVYLADGTKIHLTQNANGGSSTYWGADTLLRYRFGQQSLFTALSYVDGTTDSGGKTIHLDRISNFNVRLGGTFHIFPQWNITPRISWRSDPKETNPTTSLTQPASVTSPLMENLYQIDLYTAWRPLSFLEVYLKMTNMTNHAYAMRGALPSSSVPAELFTILAGVQAEL